MLSNVLGGTSHFSLSGGTSSILRTLKSGPVKKRPVADKTDSTFGSWSSIWLGWPHSCSGKWQNEDQNRCFPDPKIFEARFVEENILPAPWNIRDSNHERRWILLEYMLSFLQNQIYKQDNAQFISDFFGWVPCLDLTWLCAFLYQTCPQKII